MGRRSITVTRLNVPFKAGFQHAAAQRHATASIIVAVGSESGLSGFGEGCPRPYVTGETLAGAVAFARLYGPALIDEVYDVERLQSWIADNQGPIDQNPAAFCAIEMALIDFLARERGCSAEALLGLPELNGVFRYSAVIGDGTPSAFERQFDRYRMAGFQDFKVKLSGDLQRDRAKIACFDRMTEGGLRLRVDANNLWHQTDECIAFLDALDHPLFAVEEPLPVHALGEFLKIAEALRTRIVLDESFLRSDELERLAATAPKWILNCRVSKLGGMLRTITAVDRARRLGLDIIVGAHVGETSLLSRAALTVAQRAGPALIAQEGAFGTHLLTSDPCSPVVMFDGAGILRAPGNVDTASEGWGLKLALSG